MVVFFGDSITECSNSECSFTDYLDADQTIFNFGVSGTTMGEYSIYPVDGHSLISSYNVRAVNLSDKIFLEYGINDVSAMMCGFVKEQQVLISFVKALDGIKQLNSKAEIYFLTISDDYDIVKSYAQLQCIYLEDDYFKDFNFKFPYTMWADYYWNLMQDIKKRVPTIPMINNFEFLDKYLSDDKIHPNKYGHEIIAENIKKYL